jgi:hypothetical protein
MIRATRKPNRLFVPRHSLSSPSNVSLSLPGTPSGEHDILTVFAFSSDIYKGLHIRLASALLLQLQLVFTGIPPSVGSPNKSWHRGSVARGLVHILHRANTGKYPEGVAAGHSIRCVSRWQRWVPPPISRSWLLLPEPVLSQTMTAPLHNPRNPVRRSTHWPGGYWQQSNQCSQWLVVRVSSGFALL